MKKTERSTVQSMGQGQVESPKVRSVCIALHVLGQRHRDDRRCTKCRCLGSERWPGDIGPINAGHKPGCGLVVRDTWVGGQAWVQELVV